MPSNAKCLNCSFCLQVQCTFFFSLWTNKKLHALMLQNLLKVFNGYWRMDFPDWGLIHVGDLSSRRIIQQLKFLPSSSYIFVSSSKNSTSFFQTKLASQHDGGDILAFFSRRRHFYDLMDHLWPGSWLFCLSTVSTHLFQLKATVLTIFVCC